MTRCDVCHQPIRSGEQYDTFNGQTCHQFPARCVKAVARRCMAIAREIGDEQGMGAYRTFRAIRKEFVVKGK